MKVGDHIDVREIVSEAILKSGSLPDLLIIRMEDWRYRRCESLVFGVSFIHLLIDLLTALLASLVGDVHKSPALLMSILL